MLNKTRALAALTAAAIALATPVAGLAKGHNNGKNGAGFPTLGGVTAEQGGNAVSDLVRSDTAKDKLEENIGRTTD